MGKIDRKEVKEVGEGIEMMERKKSGRKEK